MTPTVLVTQYEPKLTKGHICLELAIVQQVLLAVDAVILLEEGHSLRLDRIKEGSVPKAKRPPDGLVLQH